MINNKHRRWYLLIIPVVVIVLFFLLSAWILIQNINPTISQEKYNKSEENTEQKAIQIADTIGLDLSAGEVKESSSKQCNNAFNGKSKNVSATVKYSIFMDKAAFERIVQSAKNTYRMLGNDTRTPNEFTDTTRYVSWDTGQDNSLEYLVYFTYSPTKGASYSVESTCH